MRYLRKFDAFDPIKSNVPDHPFRQFPDIARRARALLKGRTAVQCRHVADTIDWLVEDYFATEKSDYIRRVLERGGWELGYLRYEYRNEAGLTELLDNWPAEADDSKPFIPDDENTNEVDALRECIGNYGLDSDDEIPNATEAEYFAVLALLRIAEGLDWLGLVTDLPETVQSISSGISVSSYVKRPEQRLSIAGDCGIEAMDAICWAESLKQSASINQQLLSVRVELAEARRHTEELATSKARQRISVTASKAAIKRHAENRAMKADVFAWCTTQLHTFPSMDKAAEAVAGNGKLVPVAVRTAREWIGEWAKLNRSARTP